MPMIPKERVSYMGLETGEWPDMALIPTDIAEDLTPEDACRVMILMTVITFLCWGAVLLLVLFICLISGV